MTPLRLSVSCSAVRPLVVAAVMAFAAGCTTTQGTSGSYRAELGQAPSAETLAGVSAEVLQLYGFSVESAQPDLIQTDWRYSQDGYRDRATVRVRPRGSGFYVGSIRITVEAQSDGGNWALARPTSDLEDQYAEIQANVRQRLERYMTQN